MQFSNHILFKVSFFLIVGLYCLLYAPYGLNDTDGGFITGYAWRVLNGELVYQDFIYVRPPVSIYLRALEMSLVPDHLELITERIFFYSKIALYSYLGASVLLKGHSKWVLALIGFMVSSHNYPAAAWHTVDGILLVTTGFWLLFNKNHIFLAGVFVFLGAMCKQSFYPAIPLYLGVLLLAQGWKAFLQGIFSLSIVFGAFYLLLHQLTIWDAFVAMTTGSTTSGQAIQRGYHDFFQFDYRYWLAGLLLIPLFFDQKIGISKQWLVYGFLAFVIGVYGYVIYKNQFFTPPVGQSRFLFLIAFMVLVVKMIQRLFFKNGWSPVAPTLEKLKALKSYLPVLSLLAISWMSAISWGYNFPILFSTPYVFVCYLLIKENTAPDKKITALLKFGFLILILLSTFRFAYEYVYHDGKRSELTQDMEVVFPKLSYIYSDSSTFEKYQDLKNLHEKYGASFCVLPGLPLANYLTNTQAPLPLDWIFNSETNKQNEGIYARLNQREAYYFLDKQSMNTIINNPKYEVSKYVFDHFDQLEETEYFIVFK